jgi:small conductance mechanosensitive channel
MATAFTGVCYPSWAMPPVKEMFRTKSHAWQQAGLAAQVRREAAVRAKVARRHIIVLTPLLAAVIAAYVLRGELKGYQLPIRIGAAVALVVLGTAIARDLGRALGPMLYKRMDPATAGTVGFLIRLGAGVVAIIFALSIAGLKLETLLAASAFTAVIIGLAAQQTLGNVIAGMVLLSARPFRVGDRVRLQAGPLAGQIEGTVASLGLLYTELAEGEDTIMVPNSVVLNSSVTPLREPDRVEFLARLTPDVKPSELQELLHEKITVETRSEPDIELRELDDEEMVVRISAAPKNQSDGSKLADEILEVVAELTRGNGSGSGGGTPDVTPDDESPRETAVRTGGDG